MAREYPRYDWRGIAMLTEQLGELFEPSQLKLLDSKQKHEMNLLMAKQAWDMETKELEVLNTQYKSLTTKIEAADEAAINLGTGELARASSLDGAMQDEAGQIYDIGDLGTLTKMRKAQNDMRLAVTHKEDALASRINLNEHAKLGSLYSDTFTKPTETAGYVSEDKPYAGKDYKALSDADKDNVLSYDERMHAARLYVNDYYLDDKGQGTKRNIGGTVVENVTPEGHAFLAGYEHDTGLGKREDIERADLAIEGAKGSKALEQWYNLDAAWMNETPENRKLIAGALKNPELLTSLNPALKDTYLLMKKRDQLSIAVAGELKGELVQPLDGSYFESERDPNLFLPESMESRIQKPWVKEGLDQDMYDNIRRLGSKAGKTRGAFEYIVKNWDKLSTSQISLALTQVKKEYNQLIGL